MKKEITLNKPNELITIISKKEVLISQRKAYNLFLKYAQNLIKLQNYEGNIFKIECNELHDYAELKHKDLKYIEEKLTELMEIIIKIKDRNNPQNWKPCTLLSYIEKKGDYYYYELNNFILKALKEQDFVTPLNLLIINSLTSNYSIIFYEIAMRYHKLKIPRMRLEEIRELTNTEDKYKETKYFTKFVLDFACKEISEKTDINLTYTSKRTGRRISHIDFIIEKKSNFYNKKNQTIKFIKNKKELDFTFQEFEQEKIELDKEIFLDKKQELELKRISKKIPYGISKALFEEYLDIENFEFLKFCLEKTEKEVNKNPIAYFKTLVRTDSIKLEFSVKLNKQELKQIEENKINKKANVESLIKIIMNEKGDLYQKHREDVIYFLKKGFLEDKKYLFKSNEELPEEIIEKYIILSLKTKFRIVF